VGDVSQAVEQAGRSWLSRNFWTVAHQLLGWTLFIWSFICFFGASDNVGWRWLVILGWPVVVWIVIVVHELGHAAATIAVGWRVVAIAMGPIAFHLWNRDFAVVPRSKRTEVEGFVLPLPANQKVFTVPRKALISTGGPAANILLAGMLFVASSAPAEAAFCGQLGATPAGFAGELPEDADLSACFGPAIDWTLIYFGAALASLASGLGSLMPAGANRSGTDGDHLIGMMRSTRAEWRKYRAYSYLRMLLEHQTRLRELPRWLVDEASVEAEQEGGALQQAHEMMLIGMVLDSPPVDLEQTRSLLDAHRKSYGPSEWLNCCDAYFSAVWEGDADRARSLTWTGERSDELRPLFLAAEAATLAREGKDAAARETLALMRTANRERSIFPDHTFRDIGRQIEAVAA